MKKQLAAFIALAILVICLSACRATEQEGFEPEAEKHSLNSSASPIYYHGLSGQLKCTIDRFYSVLYPKTPETLKKVAMFLSSGDPYMYDGAKFSYDALPIFSPA